MTVRELIREQLTLLKEAKTLNVKAKRRTKPIPMRFMSDGAILRVLPAGKDEIEAVEEYIKVNGQAALVNDIRIFIRKKTGLVFDVESGYLGSGFAFTLDVKSFIENNL
jgi:ppGpp synthetase/RelA/SpoT-type nucleotidyltranferase